METEPLQIRLAVRELVEFVLRRGSIDSRFSGFDRANEGSRIHRKLQKAAGDSYKAEVPFKAERTVGDYVIRWRDVPTELSQSRTDILPSTKSKPQAHRPSC